MGHDIPAGKPSVLFLCVHNAGRSQMAAAWLAAIAGDEGARILVLRGPEQCACTSEAH